MENMTIGRVAELCGGVISEACCLTAEIRQIAIDSREVTDGDLFAAFRGERVDGHNYIGAAFDRGAACALAEYVPAGEKRPVIVVPDILTALEKIAAGYRRQFDIPVIGITGSVGKTTAKEMIAAVLEQHYQVLKTEGNLNNQIGVPMMLSRLERRHQAAVIEMGISNFGEMRSLGSMVQPNIAVFTVIGHAHLEFLHDLDGVLRAKSEMLESMPDTSPVVVNGDDVKLLALQCRQKKISYGFGAHCDVRAENLVNGENLCCDIVCGLRRIPVRIPAFGKHHVYAALAAATVGMLLGLSDEEIIDGISCFQNVGRRGELFEANGMKIIDDSYNANPDSVKCGIDSLIKTEAKRHVCILGDMLELGEDTLSMHYGVGEYARENHVDLVLTSGTCAKEISRAAGARGQHFETREDLIRALPELLREGDCILVKASKGSHFEIVSAALRKDMNVSSGRNMISPESLLGAPAPVSAPIVLLDLDDTILDFRKAEHRALARSLDELGIHHDEEVLSRYSEINRQHWERLENGEITRPQVLLGRFEQLLSEIGTDKPAAELRNLYEYNLSQGHFFVDGAEALLRSLYGKYRLFLVSNGTDVVQQGRLSSAGIREYFENIFISEKLGVNKPDPQFFERCFAQIPGFDRNRCVLIGDSLTSDIRGGINSGLKTIWFNLRGYPPRPDIVPDYCIESLQQIPELLQTLFHENAV